MLFSSLAPQAHMALKHSSGWCYSPDTMNRAKPTENQASASSGFRATDTDPIAIAAADTVRVWRPESSLQGTLLSRPHCPRLLKFPIPLAETREGALTSSNLAWMMVIQCLMVVMESGWQRAKRASPLLVALLSSALFSSSFFMNSCSGTDTSVSCWCWLNTRV